jgi:RimJ/RimL family protein N-acetyltransferase
MVGDSIAFEAIDRGFLEQSLLWLEDKAFAALILAAPVTPEAQEQWFASLPSRDDYAIWGIKIQGQWVGACGLKHICHAQHNAEYWGYIYPTSLRGKGFGHHMFTFLVSEARQRGLQSLYLHVSIQNQMAIDAYTRWGFVMMPHEDPTPHLMEITL